MDVQQAVQMDSAPVNGPQTGITANTLVIASLLFVVFPTVVMFAVAAGVLVLLR